MVTLRGFARYPKIATMQEVYGLQAGRHRRLSDVQGPGPAGRHGRRSTPAQRSPTRSRRCKKLWNKYDFFFLHYKYTDSTGEDGNFAGQGGDDRSARRRAPAASSPCKPDVLIVTGDHSTPSKLKSHSWHPVPTLLWAQHLPPRRRHRVRRDRTACRGGLGQFQAKYLMPLALAHAGRLGKYGA